MIKLLLIAAVIVLAPTSGRAEVLSPPQAKARAAAGELTIIDVRLPMEWAETGLPTGAQAISLQDPKTFAPRTDFVEDVVEALDGDRDRPIALICARGNRSAFARELLASAGFSNVHDIGEGVVGGPAGPGWLERGLPTEPCKVC